MADEPTNPTVQGDPAPVAPPVPPTDSTPPPGDPKDGDSPDKLKSALDSERALRAQHEREAKAEKKRADDLAAKLAEHEQAKLSETEKAVARAEAAEKALTETQERLRSQALRHAVATAAAAASFHNPADAYRFLDLDAIEFDDDGEPKGITEAVAALAKEHAYLVKSGENPKGPQPTPRANGTNGQMTEDEKRTLDRQFALSTRRRF